jgi:PAS domain S-box-containing protein
MASESGDQIFIIGHDVSAWVTARSTAREEEERLRLLNRNAPDFIFTCDPDGHLVSTNRAAQKLSGYPQRQLQDMTCRDLLADESVSAVAEFARAAAGEQPVPFDLTIRRRDGLRARLEIRVWPMTHDGMPAGYQGIGRNVTERQEAEQAAQRARHESEALTAIAEDLT